MISPNRLVEPIFKLEMSLNVKLLFGMERRKFFETNDRHTTRHHCFLNKLGFNNDDTYSRDIIQMKSLGVQVTQFIWLEDDGESVIISFAHYV